MLFDFFPVHGIATSCHFDKWWSAKTRGPHGKSEENQINLKATRMWWAEPTLIYWISWISHSKMYVRFQTMTYLGSIFQNWDPQIQNEHALMIPKGQHKKIKFLLETDIGHHQPDQH
jgi:hypothetical protein